MVDLRMSCPFCLRDVFVVEGHLVSHRPRSDLPTRPRTRCYGSNLRPDTAAALYKNGGTDAYKRRLLPLHQRAEVAYVREGGVWKWVGNEEGRRVDAERRALYGDKPPRIVRPRHQCGGVLDEDCGRFQCQSCKQWFPWCYGADDGEYFAYCDACAVRAQGEKPKPRVFFLNEMHQLPPAEERAR